MCRQPQQSCNPSSPRGTIQRSALKRSGHERGQAVVESAFLVPWIFFLFVGVLDVGFYCYALMTVENAARLAALQTSQASNTAALGSVACPVAIAEMQSLPNIYKTAACQSVDNNCTTTIGPPTQATPLYVGACLTTYPNIAGLPDLSSKVLVSYYSVQLVPIPGILPSQMIINRTAEVQVNLNN